MRAPQPAALPHRTDRRLVTFPERRAARLNGRLLTALLLFAPTPASAELDPFFAGYVYQFGYGSGTSSNNPRVELTIHYCGDGRYYSQGQSCRPNLIAQGYQCTPLADNGQWRTDGDQLLWRSFQGNSGALTLLRQSDGSVTDPRGNPFIRLGPAACR